MTQEPNVTASTRLRAIAHDLRRLSVCHHNPERYHEFKSELVNRVERMADELQGGGVQAQPRHFSAPRGEIVTFERKAPRKARPPAPTFPVFAALREGFDNPPSRK